uniref:Uncharacterized protein n=1 Tax=Stegastes partitus TaxID=144197 RepID=A0A3B5AAL8_9TELE
GWWLEPRWRPGGAVSMNQNGRQHLTINTLGLCGGLESFSRNSESSSIKKCKTNQIKPSFCLCFRLERRWLLWHDFMKELGHLEAWLLLAERAITSPNSAHFTYSAAKEQLRKFERLRRESGSRLVQLDSLTRRNRTLTRMFHGAMKTRLLAAAGECGRRWDDVNQELEAVSGRLQVLTVLNKFLTLINAVVLVIHLMNPPPQRLPGLLPTRPPRPMSTWGWSGTPRWTSDARSPVTTPTRRTSAPAQVRGSF